MIKIGILGEIGSGKSYVATNFGYPVFNADEEVGKLYKKNKKIFIKLKKIFREASLSSDIAGILHWDMSTMMPPKSRNQRAEQLAYLSKLSHDKVSSNEVRDLIFEAKSEERV